MQVELTIPALPYGRSDVQVQMAFAAPVPASPPPPPAPVVLDSFSSISGSQFSQSSQCVVGPAHRAAGIRTRSGITAGRSPRWCTAPRCRHRLNLTEMTVCPDVAGVRLPVLHLAGIARQDHASRCTSPSPTPPGTRSACPAAGCGSRPRRWRSRRRSPGCRCTSRRAPPRSTTPAWPGTRLTVVNRQDRDPPAVLGDRLPGRAHRLPELADRQPGDPRRPVHAVRAAGHRAGAGQPVVPAAPGAGHSDHDHRHRDRQLHRPGAARPSSRRKAWAAAAPGPA